MIDKSIYNRIEKLEFLYPVTDFDAEEYTKNIIEELETVLQYPIRDRIKLSKEKYYDIDTLYSDVFSFLTTKELRTIAYYNEKDKIS